MSKHMNSQNKLKTKKDRIAMDTLLPFLQTGLLLSVALVAPNIVKVFAKKDHKLWKDYYPSAINATVLKLWRKGYVEVVESGNDHIVRINQRGKQQVLRYHMQTMKIPPQQVWDGLWRIVFFDIAASKKQRNVFRFHLKRLGFFSMQESTYVYPYPCTKEIQFLREVLTIPHEVKLGVLRYLENDEDLCEYFGLRRD